MTETTGRVVLITGASSGIGAATARRLASRGLRVVVNYLNSGAAAEKVVGILLQGACQSQHIGNIQASREALARIPRDWLKSVLIPTISKSLNIEDEWEYRRLLELLKELSPEIMPPFIEQGLASQDLGIHEAAEDFAAIGAGKQA